MKRFAQPLRGILLALFLIAGWRHAVGAPWVTAHYVYWEENVMAPAQIDMTPITHLIYFAALPNQDGSLDTSNLDEPAAVAAAAHNAGKLALVCVGGGDDTIYAGFSSAITAAHRAAFVANIASWVKNNAYDGVDIDMEPINDSDTANFVAFIQALSAALKANNQSAVLTADIAVEGSAPAGAFLPEVSLFDQINLETYDLSGNYPGWVTWYDSCIYTNNQTFPQDSGGGPLPSADEFLQQWIGYGIPASKLGLGIDCQGVDWVGATGPEQSIANVTALNYRDYNDIITNSYSAAAYHYDNGAKAPYLSLANDFISYTDPALCADQVTYMQNTGLGGLMVWQIQAQYMPNGDQPLLQAIATALGTVVTYTVTPSAGANGGISPNTPQIVNSGTSIGFTATPANGYGVDKWYLDGSPVQAGGTAYTLSNIQASHGVEVTFTAGSVPKPYPGLYDGLLVDGSGSVSVSLAATGKFTGKVIIAGVSHSLKGQFISGTSQGATFGEAFNLQLGAQGTAPGSYLISGSVGGTALTAYHTAHINRTVAPETGRYLLQLTATTVSATIPQVPGKATLTVSKTGSAHLVGKLPDGTSFSASAPIIGGMAGDQCIIYSSIPYRHATPRGARGFLIGAITFPSGAVTGPLNWIKPTQTTGPFTALINTNLVISP